MKRRSSVVRSVRLFTVVVGLLPLLWVPVSQGQITSITSSGLNTQVSHGAGQPNYDITGGTRPGNGPNLFHSFGNFSIGANHVAQFLNDSGLATSNILNRVTGGHPSNIFGEINTTSFPGANLYLINPAGVLFGPTATLNVSGSVHVSTADYLRLADGLRFNAVPGPQDALLSQAPVVAFGFLNPHPRPITVNGATLLLLDPGQSLSLIGGDLRVSGGTPAPTLAAPGQINLVSLASRGEVRVGSSGEPTVSTFGRLGTITLSNQANLHTEDSLGGAVVLRSGKLVMDNDVQVQAGGYQRGGTISIEARDSAVLRNGAFLWAYGGSSSESSSEITIEAGRVLLHRSNIWADGGTVVVNSPGTVRMEGSHVNTVDSGASRPDPSHQEQAGAIRISAGDSVVFRKGTELTADALGVGGKAGTIMIETGKNFVSDTSSLSARALAEVSDLVKKEGTGGTVDIKAGEKVVLYSSQIDTGVPATEGPAGNISITAGHGVLLRDSGLGASTGGGRGGKIAIDTGKGLLSERSTISARSEGGRIIPPSSDVSQQGGQVQISAKDLVRLDRSQIDTGVTGSDEPFGGFVGGGIGIQAGRSLQLLKGTVLKSDGSGHSTHGGTVDLHANHTVLLDRSRVETGANANEDGIAGSITIQAGGSVRLLRNSALNSDGYGADLSRGGKIVLDAGRDIVVDSSDLSTKFRGTIAGNNYSEGMNLTAGDSVFLLNGASLSADGGENGGGIQVTPVAITAGRNVLVDASRISADQYGNFVGSQIEIVAGESVRVLHGSRLSVNTQTFGTGALTIQAGTTFVGQDSSFLARGRDLNGGTIRITAPDQVRFTRSLVDTSTLGVGVPVTSAGTIALTSETVRLQNSRLLSNGGTSTGGTIRIKTTDFRPDAASVLDVGGGTANGTITIGPQP